ncbi:MAG: hypothetical protein ABI147_02105 [Acidobacteriaceae bacterium]
MRFKGFYIGRAQRVAAALLLCLLCECLWMVAHQPLTPQDYRFARCGREMWEKPSPLAGYFTTCGNLNGDGTFAYRLAGFPLTTQRWVLLAADRFRKPQNRIYSSGSLNGSTWEARHELHSVKYLLRLPFVFFALWLGGGLWWVARRLFGNEGGGLALALYVFCPAIVRFASTPNNEVLAMWGLYGLVYTAIGVAHALQGPRHKWKPRIGLFIFALGLTACAHLLAALVGFAAGTIFLFYLADRRRSYVSQVLIFSALGALAILFASFSFRVSAFLYVFIGGGARFWFSMEGVRALVSTMAKFPFTHTTLPAEGPILLATLAALWIYVAHKPSRYFGNTSPLLMVLVLMPLYTTQTTSAPWLWALPFLFTFIGGVLADALEASRKSQRRHRLLLALTGGLVLTQAMLCIGWLAGFKV